MHAQRRHEGFKSIVGTLDRTRKGDLRTPIPWLRIAAPIRSQRENRTPELYSRVIDQFEVESNPRYTPRDGKTYCNIFVWDVTTAMGAEVPHWTNPSSEPVAHDIPGARRLNCNAIYEWLHSSGAKYGWHDVELSYAVQAALRGFPSIAIRSNPDGNGHVVIIRPELATSGDPICAQAGRRCLSRIPLSEAFGGNQPEFWTHE